MNAKLKMFGLPIDVLEVVLADGRILCPGLEAMWHELFLVFICHRAALLEEKSPHFFAHVASGLQDALWLADERRAELRKLMDHPEIPSLPHELQNEAQSLLDSIFQKSLEEEFWDGLSINREVKNGRLSFEIFHADKRGSHRVTIGAGLREGEQLDLQVEVQEDREAAIQIFGPMLSALCFGKARMGTLNMRPATIEVKLQWFEGSMKEDQNAAQALADLAQYSAENLPRILWL